MVDSVLSGIGAMTGVLDWKGVSVAIEGDAGKENAGTGADRSRGRGSNAAALFRLAHRLAARPTAPSPAISAIQEPTTDGSGVGTVGAAAVPKGAVRATCTGREAVGPV